jgi:hypothetical protein
VRVVEYKNVLKPSVDYLERCGSLMLGTASMSKFLGLSPQVTAQLVYTDRIPLPCRLGLGKCFRWSALELLEWVEAGCPRRTEWIKMRGSSGSSPQWRWS